MCETMVFTSGVELLSCAGVRAASPSTTKAEIADRNTNPESRLYYFRTSLEAVFGLKEAKEKQL